ncbi:hypothetical protein [Dokdonella sp.]|uniref:hypothetical protein n=1 Tax=Dokdonella sp. TaxID=2291710 RepID=UPI001B03137D|nr:hypothetical protein [Dokdonella sp.]MBO9662005.1 hypothetical protein [Dokdonella sp.]
MKPASAPSTWLGLFALLLLLQLPLILNPGYFSHDELQWWARADVADWAALPWESWTRLGVFQYRPLTFNLWLALSYTLADEPVLMHAVFVGLGSLNAVLLGVCVEKAGAPRRHAVFAAILFVLSPYVAYVHGWVATLADLLTLLLALASLRLLQRMARPPGAHDLVTGVLIVVLSSAALLCKEAAIVLPFALLPALYRHPRPRAVLGMIALAATPVAIYLLLRLPVILATPPGSEAYAWSVGNVPRRLAEYLLFPFLPPLFEVAPVLAKSPPRLLGAAACLSAALVALGTLGWRWPVAWLALFAALLAPVLVLGTSYGQYAYLASAAAVGIATLAWTRLRFAPRIALGVVAAVACVHGMAIAWRMHDIGIAHRNFYADLTERLGTARAPLRLAAADGDRWMIERFVAGVPSYRGVAVAGRVEILDRTDGSVEFVVQKDGHLAPPSR